MRGDVEVRLGDELRAEEHPEDFVADPLFVRGELFGEDVPQPPHPLRDMVVCARKVKHRQVDSEEILRIRQLLEVIPQIPLHLQADWHGDPRPPPLHQPSRILRHRQPRLLSPETLLPAGDSPIKLALQPRPEPREELGEDIRDQDDSGDESRAFVQPGELVRVRVEVHNVAVFLAEGACAAQGGQGVVEEVGEGAGLGRVAVEEAGAVDFAEEVGEAVEEDGLEVGVFLGGADCGGGLLAICYIHRHNRYLAGTIGGNCKTN